MQGTRTLPTITAHSGCEGTAPGGLESISLGIGCGAQIVEVDVRVRDEDSVPVLAHDKSEKKRPTAVTLKAALECVKECSRKAGGEDVQVNLDLKEFDRVEAVCRVIEECEMGSRVFFTGVSEENLAGVMKAAPGIRLYVNVDVPTKKLDAFYARIGALIEGDKKGLFLGANTHYKYVTPEYVEFWHSRGHEVSVFTIDKVPLATEIYGCGADNLTTRTPKSVIPAIKGI